MKKFALALLSILIFAAPAFAIVGGPWDNNVPGNPNKVNPSSINGTYQGTVKGKNFAGVLRFSSASAGSFHNSTVDTMDMTGTITYFYIGTSGVAAVDTTIDLGGRTISGIVLGGLSGSVVPIYYTRPATATTPLTVWTVKNTPYLAGTFDAKFSKIWASNSFSGTGTLAVTGFDENGFTASLVTNPTTANPNNFITTIQFPVKISGVKTSDTVLSGLSSFNGTYSAPVITQILP